MQESKHSSNDLGLQLPMPIEDRKEYEGNMERKLADIGSKIDEMAVKAEELKEQAANKFEDLKKKRDEAAVKFEELKKQSSEAWKEFKGHMDTALEDLSHAVNEMKSGCCDAKSKFEKQN